MTTFNPRLLLITDNVLLERLVVSHCGQYMDVHTCAHDASDRLAQGMDADIVLVEFGSLIASGVKLFDNLRKINPGCRILLALDGLTVTLAVELIKCGVTDLIELPVDPDVLAAKLKRLMLDDPQPVVPIPGLTTPAPPENRRKTFRAEATGTLPAQVTFRDSHFSAVAIGKVIDLSLAAGSWRGGVSFTLAPQDESKLGSVDWPPGYQFQLEINLVTELKAIPVSATVTRTTLLGDGAVGVAAQYELKHSDDMSKLRRYWVALQRERNRLRSQQQEDVEFGSRKTRDITRTD